MLTRLRFEGKQQLGKNLRETGELLGFFQKEVQDHMRLEEKVLFPFLRAHIPRFEPMIYLLLSEHADFRNSLKELKNDFSKMKRFAGYPDKAIRNMTEHGKYFICLCRNHQWAESESLYKVAIKELQPAEKRLLVERMAGHAK